MRAISEYHTYNVVRIRQDEKATIEYLYSYNQYGCDESGIPRINHAKWSEIRNENRETMTANRATHILKGILKYVADKEMYYYTIVEFTHTVTEDFCFVNLDN